jgi:tetratricopeptide (TPR) repeat protein
MGRQRGAPRTACGILLFVLFFLCLTGCGFFSEEHREAAASKTPSVHAASPDIRNYPAFSAVQWLNLSRNLYQEGKYLESIGAAQTALSLRPQYAEAYNNIGAAYAALRLWDQAILSDQMAVHLDPSFQLARNNLSWAQAQKASEKR